MSKSTRKLLNLHEEATHLRLKAVCDKYGAHVFPKIRIADVMTIEKSGLKDEEYRFALQSHFDFVVADDGHRPLFAIEFDGPSHKTPGQKSRDQLKNIICERLLFPLLRINSRYLPKKYRNIDLLSWLIEIWFFREDFNKAQGEGSLPLDAVFDPAMIVSLPGRKERFPLWLSAEIRTKIQLLHKRGKCFDFAPNESIGVDDYGNYHGVMWLLVTEGAGVVTSSAIHAQQFPLNEIELLSELLVFQLYEGLEAVLRSESLPVPKIEIDATIRSYQQQYKPRMI